VGPELLTYLEAVLIHHIQAAGSWVPIT
jgi:hypothetical protein